MSYEEFRKRIDTARQILVGAVPSPAGQIDQITYALMYKFMNDIDDESVSYGGKRQYFTGEYEKFNWHNLMAPSLEAYDRLELYRQAIQGMAKNPNIPELFREIYQNAFLPFNSPNVLTLFLNEINKFSHGDSDDIGDAYEHLLSITGAQGDVGQFRTPRHIIKFIVEAVNPTKTDTVLDPAAGTAGFLIAAYNHVKTQHDGRHNLAPLTADDKTKLHKNYRGYDIDPAMVRTASVNMYLHGFAKPDIRNHDTLSSAEYWDERFDVILANPPFMTPKGGIQPHKKFSIKANRAEVLFVDYIANHLNPVSGRAGIVVPEGIIFQSGKAYKELRKKLVEEYLYAVVSLPAGVFQPYSGVKTSVLLFDKQLAKKQDILFVKVENDGFSLGAQRRAVSGDQLPEALAIIKKYQAGETFESSIAHVVSKTGIAETGDYNLSGDRYVQTDDFNDAVYDIISLGDLEKEGRISFLRGQGISKKDIVANGKNQCIHYGELYTTYSPKIDDVLSRTNLNGRVLSEIGDVMVPATTTADAMGIAVARSLNKEGVVIGGDINIIRTNNKYVLSTYLAYAISNYPVKNQLATYAKGINILHLSNSDLRQLRIVLPPLEIQHQIVTELDGYQKIIDAANTIVQSYKPTIKNTHNWKMEKISDLVNTMTSPTKIKNSEVKDFGDVPVVDQSQLPVAGYVSNLNENEIIKDIPVVVFGDHTKVVKFIDFKFVQGADGIKILRVKDKQIVGEKYLYFSMINMEMPDRGYSRHWSLIKEMEIPLPPLEIQDQIVAELEAEQELINANKKLIDIYTQKIKTKLAEIWGE